MTAEIIPFGDFQLCPCGAGVASSLTAGGFVCATCAEEAQKAQDLARCAEIMSADPNETSLDDLLKRLVRS